ncbi:MAG: vanadium-dependent haloperoxidase [Bacteroidota bacterium]
MKIIQSKMWFLLAIIGLFFQSCQKDENLTEELPAVLATPVNNNNNGPGGGQGGDIASLDNELVIEWTDLLLELDRYATGMRPCATARALAYIHLATYETAVPGMRRYESNERRLQGLRIRREERPRNVDYEIALNACYADVLDHFIINVPDDLKAQITALESAKESELAGNQSNRLVEDSKKWGVHVARQVIAYSQTDEEGESQLLEPQPLSYEPPTGDGFWTYSADPERALFPYWESVRTFAIGSDETTTVPPIPYSEDPNSEYFGQMMEVYNVNNTAKADDNEDLWIAEFWSDDVEGLMMSPPGRQYSIANQLIDQYSLDLQETLVMYLKLGFSLNDAAVSTWKYKYEHMVMRPNVFIHEFIDADFQTNLYRLIYWPNPSFPGYPSGHSCFASAAAGIFIDVFGSGTDFTDRSHEGRQEFRGEPRTFTSFEQMAEENAFSRIPLGVHIRMDCAEGLRLGYEISDAVNELDLRRRPNN